LPENLDGLVCYKLFVPLRHLKEACKHLNGFTRLYGLAIIDRRVRLFNARIVNPILMEYLHAAREAIFKCHFLGKAMKSGNFSITSIVDNVTHIIDKYS
jgi:hypothetical protein